MRVRLSDNRQKWLQIAAALRREIETLARSGERRLPTEAVLSERFGVSLMTLRHALSSLEAQGLIERRRRLGTLITDRALQPRKLMMIGKVADVFVQQQSEWIEVLSTEEVLVPAHLGDLFPREKRVFRMERSRHIDGVRSNYAVNHMRLDVAAALDFNLLRSMPVSQVIHDHTDFKIGSIEQNLAAELAEPNISTRLDLEPLDAVMVINGITRDANGEVLDTARLIYRGDMFTFHTIVES